LSPTAQPTEALLSANVKALSWYVGSLNSECEARAFMGSPLALGVQVGPSSSAGHESGRGALAAPSGRLSVVYAAPWPFENEPTAQSR